MHQLWSEYIVALIGLRPQDVQNGLVSCEKYDAAMQSSLCSKLVKADFSGAKVEVVNAKNLSMIGL
jgi:hypothetical protein